MASLIQDVKAELASRRLRQQALRFVRLDLVAFGAQLATMGTGDLGWKALGAVAVGAAETALRQWAPVVPWAQLETALRVRLKPAAAAPAAAPAPSHSTAALADAPAPAPAAVPAASAEPARAPQPLVPEAAPQTPAAG